MTRVLLLRHGQTEWNQAKRLQGHLDAPLTALGQTEAQRVGESLREVAVDQIWSSDLGRATHTRDIAFQGRGRSHCLFRERRYGVFEGLTRADAQRRYPRVWARSRGADPDYRPPGGESRRQFVARIGAALWCLHRLHRGQTVAVVTHGGFIAYAHEYVNGLVGARAMTMTPMPSAYNVPNASVTELVVDADGWRVHRFADTSHLLH